MKGKRGKKGSKEKSATEQAMSKALMNQTKGSRAVEKMMEVGRGARPAPKAPTEEKAFPFLSKTPSKSSQVVEKVMEAGRSGKAVPKKSSVVAAAVPPIGKKAPEHEIVIRKPRPGGVFLEQNPWTNPKASGAPDVDAPTSEERRPTAPPPVVEVTFQPLREARPKEPAGGNAPLSLEDIVAMAAARRGASAGASAPEPSREETHEQRIVDKRQAGRPMNKTAVSSSHGQSAGKRVKVTPLGSGAWNTLGSTTKAIIGSGENMIQSLRSGVGKICCARRDDESGRPSRGDHSPSKTKGPVEAAFNTASAAAGKTAEGLAAIMAGAKRAVGYVIKGALEGPVDLLNGAVKGAATVTNKAKHGLRRSSTEPHPARK